MPHLRKLFFICYVSAFKSFHDAIGEKFKENSKKFGRKPALDTSLGSWDFNLHAVGRD